MKFTGDKKKKKRKEKQEQKNTDIKLGMWLTIFLVSKWIQEKTLLTRTVPEKQGRLATLLDRKQFHYIHSYVSITFPGI